MRKPLEVLSGNPEKPEGSPSEQRSRRVVRRRKRRFTSVKHVRKELANVIHEVRTGTLDAQTANSITNACRTILQSITEIDTEKRVARIEELAIRAEERASGGQR